MISTLDSTIIGKISTQSEIDEVIKSLNITSSNVIIKPNWVDADLGSHIEADVLDLIFTSLKDKKIYIVESYTFWRTEKMLQTGEDYFSSKEATIETGKQHWDHFKTQDLWFLKHTGIDRVIAKHQVEYINITNEIWSENIADPAIVKSIVDTKFGALDNQALYGLVPSKMLDLQGSDYISLAKLKGDTDYGLSLSIKNTFGLIPDPHRVVKYHGETGSKQLVDNIIDINKIYQALFTPHFIIDGIFSASIMDWDLIKSHLLSNLNIIIAGNDGYQVDSYGSLLTGRNFFGALDGLLSEYQPIFGGITPTQSIPEAFKIKFEI